jgi:hypothetical protein
MGCPGYEFVHFSWSVRYVIRSLVSIFRKFVHSEGLSVESFDDDLPSMLPF